MTAGFGIVRFINDVLRGGWTLTRELSKLTKPAVIKNKVVQPKGKCKPEMKTSENRTAARNTKQRLKIGEYRKAKTKPPKSDLPCHAKGKPCIPCPPIPMPGPPCPHPEPPIPKIPIPGPPCPPPEPPAPEIPKPNIKGPPDPPPC